MCGRARGHAAVRYEGSWTRWLTGWVTHDVHHVVRYMSFDSFTLPGSKNVVGNKMSLECGVQRSLDGVHFTSFCVRLIYICIGDYLYPVVDS